MHLGFRISRRRTSVLTRNSRYRTLMPGQTPQTSESLAEDVLARLDQASNQARRLARQAHNQGADLAPIVAAAVAHEIRNILTPVAVYAQMALEAPTDQELVRHALRLSAGGAERARRVAEAIVQAETDAVADVGQAVSEALRWIRPSQSFHVKLLPSSSRSPRIGQLALEQVLLNLFLNAQAARPDATVVVRCCDSGSVVVVVEIEDDAGGMPAESKRSGRRGLGLTICRYLVEAAGGRLLIRSTPGIGTTFTLQLKAAAAEAA